MRKITSKAYNGAPGEVIRALRQDKGVKLKDLSKASGYAPAAISRYEHGTRTPTITVYLDLLQTLGYDLAIVED